MSKRAFFLLFVCSLFISAVPGPVTADEMVRTDKTKIRLNIAPGQAKTGTINLENPSAEPKAVRAYLEDWTYLEPFDGSKEFSPAGTTALSAAKWITFSPSEVVMAPYGRGTINYTVKVPEEAAGGHYAVLFLESIMAQSGTEGVGVNLAVRVATLFFIEAEGKVQKSIDIRNFSVQRSARKLLEITLGVANTSNTDLTVGGTFNIMNRKGVVAARGDFSSLYTLPGNSGDLRASWSLPIDPGEYVLVLTLDLGKALEEAGTGRGPIIVKEAPLTVGTDGSVTVGGALK